jgi:uncharacterized membrane protein (UPF0127 family)
LSFLNPILKAPDTSWVLRNARHQQVVARHIESAFDRTTRNRGLLGRASLSRDSALILAPCSSVHTFFMKFAIDIAFVDRNGLIVRARQSVRPWRVQASFRAFAVVEIAAGELARSDTRSGDRLFLAAE